MPKLLSVGAIIDQTWDHYRANFQSLLSVSAWILVLAILEIISLAFYPTATKLMTGIDLNGWEMFGVILSFVSTVIAGPIVGLWIFAALVRLLKMQMNGGAINAKKAMVEGWKLLLPAIWVSILVILVLLAAMAIGIVPAVVISLLAQAVKSGVVLLIANLLLISSVIVSTVFLFKWGVEFVLAPIALFLENIKGTKALKRSKSLIKGRFWSVFIRLFVPKLVFILGGVLIMAVVVYLTNILLGAAAGLNLDIQIRLITITNSVVPILGAALLNPLIVTADYIIYNNLMQTK